jgi:hypothetical protein
MVVAIVRLRTTMNAGFRSPKGERFGTMGDVEATGVPGVLWLQSMSDYIAAVCWIGANALLAAFSLRVARFIRTNTSFAQTATVGLSIGMISILSATLLLGSIKALAGWTLVGLVSLISVAGLLALRCRSLGALQSSRIVAKPAGLSIWNIVWSLTVACGVAHVTTGLFRYPTDFDSLMYHLPIIDQWHRAHSLYAPDSSYWWTPGASEAIGLWCVAPFSGDYLVGLNNLPFVALWAVATFSFARELHMPRGWAHVTTLSSLATYTTLTQLVDASNDIALAATFVTSGVFALHFLRKNSCVDLCLCSAMLGSMCGTKYTALGYCAVLMFGMCGVLGFEKGVVVAVRTAIVVVIGIIVIGGYWYIRNWIVGGSPIYPMGVKQDIATGYPEIWATTYLGNRDPEVPALALSALWRMTGPVHTMAVLSVPLTLGVLLVQGTIRWFAWRAKIRYHLSVNIYPRAKSWNTRWFLSVVVIGSAIILLLTPFCLTDVPGSLRQLRWGYTQNRYGLCFLTSAVIAFMWLGWQMCNIQAKRWGRCRVSGTRAHLLLIGARWLGVRRCQVVAFGALTGLAGWQCGKQLSHTWYNFNFLVVGVVMVDLWILSLFVWYLWTRVTIRLLLPAALGCCSAIVVAIGLLGARWHQGYGEHYDRFFRVALFDSKSKHEWSEPICVVELRPYPFFGSRRQHRVIRPRLVPSHAWLVEYLRNNDAEILVTQSAYDYSYYLYTDVSRSVRQDTVHFTLLSESGHFAVFRFHPKPVDPVVGRSSLCPQ